MSRKDDSPALRAIKEHARFIKKSEHIPHHEALRRASQAMGMQNLQHARNHARRVGSGIERQASPRHRVFITAYWIDGSDQGRETLEMELRIPLSELVRPATFNRKATLRPFRIAGPDHVVRREPTARQHSARSTVCHVARVLRFMEATGLEPADGNWKRALKGVPVNRQLPGQDHASVWCDPASEGFLLVDEPYGHDPEEIAPKRTRWADEFGFDVIASPWPGMYNPPGSHMFFVNSREHGVDRLSAIVDALREVAPPIVASEISPLDEKWPGMSAPAKPKFVTPATIAARTASPQRTSPRRHVPRGPQRTARYVQTFVGPRRRPMARMPIPVHEEISRLLNQVRSACDHRSGVANRLDRARSELDEWIQREYTAGELPQELFFDLYYRGDHTQSIGRKVSDLQAETYIAQLRQVCDRICTYYPDCEPRRALTRWIDSATKSLQAWAMKSGREPGS